MKESFAPYIKNNDDSIENRKNMLPKGHYVFEFGGLLKNAGGMTRAMLKRANEFIGSGHDDLIILLAARGMEQLNTIEYYKEVGFPNIQENNFLIMEDYWGTTMAMSTYSREIEKIHLLSGLPVEEVGNKKNYWKNGKLFAAENMSTANNVRDITYYDTWDNEIREIYWKNRLSRSIEVKNENKKQTKIEYFYAQNGFCHTRIVNELEGNKWEVTNIKLFSEKDRTIKEFKTLEEFRRYFFISYVHTCKAEDIFVFCDPILDSYLYPGFEKMECVGNKKIYRIGVNHSTGIWAKEKKWNSPYNPRIRELIENATPPQMEGFVLLTEEALFDFRKRLGNLDILYQVSHTIDIPEKIMDIEARDKKKAVVIGRYDENVKQMTHIIKAFAKVVKKIPDVKLYFYGNGQDSGLMRNQIKELRLENSVFVEDFANNVNEIYQKASFCISASSFEGFSLALVEGLANGCPVVTYNFKYGPKEYISDGENGYLVELNNIDMLAEKIIQMFEVSLEKWKQMSLNARNSVDKYHKNQYIKRWIDMLWNVVDKHPYRNALKDMQFTILSHKYLVQLGMLTLQGYLKTIGYVPEIAFGMENIYLRLYTENKDDYIIIPIKSYMTEAGEWNIEAEFEYQKGEISICLEWNNSFFERKLELFHS